ncbi:hypothetical protein [Stieleria varia]|uniref:SseB protein N-terminal domain-containing protein n=1 Tax=Stieleria varia TaxID=2528005 RepID=A0A5C6AN25_9BACT|nr:hypothetical protein [Stieleria varia]TWU00918.1 hypothetical protein Pla52n_42880 [Stieleria varia]
MTESPDHSELRAAIEAQDAPKIRDWIAGREFVLINVRDEGADEDDEEAVGVLTAEIEEQDVWVAFSSEPLAGHFVQTMPEMFSDDEEIEGYVVDGESLLLYIPEDVGLLLDPESDEPCLLSIKLMAEVVALCEHDDDEEDDDE